MHVTLQHIDPDRRALDTTSPSETEGEEPP